MERPESVLRELLDNAIDSNADEIIIETSGGGIESIACIDNGNGIQKDDMARIAMQHATSKISTDEDLYNIHTMGFRGEALYSISSVSKLTIKSKSSSEDDAYTLVIDNGNRYPLQSGGPGKGTIVQVENLFGEIPARRAFLKRPQTESALNRSLVIKKALPFPSISFKYYQDGALKLSYEKAKDIKERVMMLYRPMGIPDADVSVLRTTGDDFSITVVAANQSVKRSDRKEIRIYVNSRPVDDYALQQAVAYGYGELLPGGSFPVAVVFIENRSELTDFNIHPTKREVKLRNGKEIHHALTLLVKNGLERKIPEIKAAKETNLFEENEIETRNQTRRFTGIRDGNTTEGKVLERIYSYQTEEKPRDNSWLEKAKELKRIREEREEKNERKREERKEEDVTHFKYIGQCFSLFLIAQKDDALYLVDQHAAHERILYDELTSQVSLQTLLAPITLEVEKDVDEFLSKHSEIYSKLGIMLSRKDDGIWEIIALPALARDRESEIVDFIANSKGDEKELESSIFAIMACKKAIKKGDYVDQYSAEELLKKVFKMKEPVCPHGRTFLIKLEKEELEKMVGRT